MGRIARKGEGNEWQRHLESRENKNMGVSKKELKSRTHHGKHHYQLNIDHLTFQNQRRFKHLWNVE